MANFLFKLKNIFLANFPNFWSKKKFFQKNWAATHNFIRVSSLWQIQKNLMIGFQENNLTDVKKESWTDPIS